MEEWFSRELKTYPNPASTLLNIEISDIEFSVQLTDINGRLLVNKDSNNGKAQLYLDALSDGIYILSIQNGSNRLARKIIIQH